VRIIISVIDQSLTIDDASFVDLIDDVKRSIKRKFVIDARIFNQLGTRFWTSEEEIERGTESSSHIRVNLSHCETKDFQQDLPMVHTLHGAPIYCTEASLDQSTRFSFDPNTAICNKTTICHFRWKKLQEDVTRDLGLLGGCVYALSSFNIARHVMRLSEQHQVGRGVSSSEPQNFPR
jgi:hypothetical protein